MDGLQLYVKRNLAGLVTLGVVGGFIMLLAELLITEHYDGTQLIAPISSVLGVIFMLAAWYGGVKMRRLWVVLLLVLSLTGLIGAYQHNFGEEDEKGEGEAVAGPAEAGTPLATSEAEANTEVRGEGGEGSEAGEGREAGEGGAVSAERGEGGEGEKGEEAPPPPLAPLGLSGLAFLGAISALAKRDEEVTETTVVVERT